ncbi:hypothetical protein HanRHA438_Chr07g0311711 [Helianthus annuus]|nr:hypothetical protein HanHA300_Chr07g0248471 [Helianthus annuus]KAJ0563631.1 hypothetical protein HanHA89_Chr07g0265281 [Helianthus annuus]KAJ0731714.1 hypothetical protein HanOQP8_Chr07g0255081 [Helianthus annuus]KAJ0908556.1 hypothetical protein HanRHA438_Chr07g0311711 [Helianthus annuus]
MWKDICSVEKEFYALSLPIGDGGKTMFWMDNWVEGGPLWRRFPAVFARVKNKEVLVS